MSLKDVLAADRILMNPRCSSKEELLEVLVHQVCSHPDCQISASAQEVFRVVLDREQQISTGLQEGIAVPHGMISELAPTMAALAVIPKGLDFECMDGLPGKFILLLIFSDDPQGRAQHLGLLAETVGLFTDSKIRESLLASASADEAWQHLSARFEDSSS